MAFGSNRVDYATPRHRNLFGEVGKVKTVLNNVNFHDFNPDDLVRNKGLKIYDKIRLDEQVKMALTTKKNAVLSSGWDIVPASAESIDEQIAEFVLLSFDQLEGTIEGVIKDAMSAYDFGFSIAEKVWTPFASGPKEIRGRIGYKTIKSKDPKNFEFDTDEFGNLRKDGLILTLEGFDRLPIDKFVIYSYQKEFANYYGTSDLRAAYKSWWAKDNIVKFQNIFMEKYAIPPIMGSVNSNVQAQVDAARDILKTFQANTVMAMPKGLMEIDLLETQRKPSDIFKEALEFYDRAISRSILVGDRLVAAGETGAYSQAEVHFKTFLWVVKDLRLEIEETIMYEQIIRPLVALNFGPDALVPRFKFNPITYEEAIEQIKAFGDLVQKGAVLSTIEDENHMREVLGFPEKSDNEEELDEPEETPAPPESEEPASPTEPAEGEEAPVVENKQARKFVQREKNRFEKRVNFKQIEKNLDTIEADTLEDMQGWLTKQQDAVIKFITGKLARGELTTGLIRTGIDLKFIKDQKDTMKAMFNEGYGFGGKDVKREIGPANFITAQQGIALPPERALSYFATKADIIVGNVKSKITEELKNVLLVGLREGTSVQELTARIMDIYKPYLETGEIEEAGRLLKPHRLEAIIRTNLSDAYNSGRLDLAKDPDLKDFIVGFEFSEILDDRTTEISREIDGKIIRADSPNLDKLTYPLHWNDRGVIVPVTKRDLPAEFMTPAEEASFIAKKQTGL
jgi:SPP1 gp7 family putative phage head morphogenesis protein